MKTIGYRRLTKEVISTKNKACDVGPFFRISPETPWEVPSFLGTPRLNFLPFASFYPIPRPESEVATKTDVDI